MNFISPVFICFRWPRRCEGGYFTKLNRASISTHCHPTLSFSLYETPSLYVHPPAALPFPHPCNVGPAVSPATAARHVSEESRSKAPEGDLRSRSKVDPSGQHWKESCVSEESQTPRSFALGPPRNRARCCWVVTSNQKRLCGGKCIPGMPKKRPEPERWCTTSPTEHPAHCNLLRVPSVLSQTPFTDSDLLPWATGGC